jgi:selenoprotein W-related protein
MDEMAGTVRVRIVYCASCGYEGPALDLARDLMLTFRYDLAAIEIIPWQDGTFDVAVDGALVHAMLRDGGFPAAATIANAVRARLRGDAI